MLLKKLIFFSAAFLTGFVVCKAQQKRSTGGSETIRQSLLWKISGKDLKAPSYILGTIHLICPDDFLWTPVMEQALDSAQKVVFEMDLDDPSLQKEVSAGMIMEDGRSLKELLSTEEYAELARFSRDSLGFPLEMMEQMKPFALMSLLSAKTLNCPVPESYEGNIMAMALKAGKEIAGLETAAEQLAVMDRMNMDSSAKQLMYIIENYHSMRIQYGQLLDAYRNQDLAALYQLIIESPDFKYDLNSLLYDRNRYWIPRIVRLAEEQSVFIAVGAGHLWGNRGVLQLLREQGYSVLPLN